ncbi:head GIN domain-containing protein [Adhaeribacter radiodurans]|uniref:DUF2807 domain-containing protein n=1 Tax=Adhaeribacter radiodurans TaxID=2745197 RepID=A0A7L7L764_9BACT|nr:head GIN domain-containing protein [Adhaeribacter radiodurans]QMU28637.1 DUF2807 domain-containing protein [Adhaeribacter radiodurans]
MKKQFNLKQKFLYTGIWALALLFLTSCDEDGPFCIKGQGDITTRTLQLQSFHEVDVNGDFEVYITQGSPQKVEVKGEPNILDELNTNVQNGKWKIEFDKCIRRSKTVQVYLTVPEVSSFYINGSGKIMGQNKLTASELSVAVNGSGTIQAELAATKVIARVMGSGDMELAGTTKQQSITIAGSGKVKSYNLAAEDVQVKVAGSGKTQVSASKTLDVDLSGSGTVFYRGNPTVNTKISGSGKVVHE